MKNSKAFTLVELLAAVVILGIMTAFSVPSIMKVITKNRDRTYIQDAKKMVTLAESRIRSGNVRSLSRPNCVGENCFGGCMLIPLNNLNSGEFKKAPNGGKYDGIESFILIRRTDTTGMPKYKYYVYLVEKYGSNYRGIDLQEISDDADVNSSIEIVNFNAANKFEIFTVYNKAIRDKDDPNVAIEFKNKLDSLNERLHNTLSEVGNECLEPNYVVMKWDNK